MLTSPTLAPGTISSLSAQALFIFTSLKNHYDPINAFSTQQDLQASLMSIFNHQDLLAWLMSDLNHQESG